MHDDELDRLFSDAQRDLPTQAELAPLSERLGLSTPAPLPKPAWPRALLGGGTLLIAAAIAVWMTWGSLASPVVPAPALPEAPAAVAAEAPTYPSSDENSASDAVVSASPPENSASAEPPVRIVRRRASPPPEVPQATPAIEEDEAPLREESEVAVMQRAIAAHRAGNREGARAALAEHRARFPEGILAEERASLEVEMLIASNPDAARARLEAFRLRYPSSGHLPRLERLLRAQ